MAWDLDGSTQYFDCIMPAAIKAAAGGPFTMAIFCDLDGATDGAFMCNMSGSSVFQVTEIFSSFNYGTSAGTRNGPVATSQTPSAVGNPYLVIISKQTGNVAPEYTLIPWVAGAPGTPVSGTITGGGATLGDGTAPGASGFIRCGQYGTSTAERINGKIIALAQYTAYKDATARATLDSWTDWLNTSGPGAGLAWAMEFTALTTRTDASGNGGDESARNGTTPYTLVADPANFFPSGGSAVNVADGSVGGFRLRSGYDAALTGLAVADSPNGMRYRSPEGSGAQIGVVANDAPSGLRLRSASETVVTGLTIADVPSGFRWRSGADSVVLGVAVGDSPNGLRFRSGLDDVAIGGGAVAIPDSSPDGLRLRSAGGAAVLGHSIVDLPAGWRLRSAPETVSVLAGTADRPSGFRWRSGYEAIVGDVPAEAPEPTIIAEVLAGRVSSGVSRTRVTATVTAIEITSAVRRFRA